MSLATYYRNALFDHSVNATLKFVYDISPWPLTNLGSRSAHFLLQCDCFFMKYFYLSNTHLQNILQIEKYTITEQLDKHDDLLHDIWSRNITV